MKKFFNVKKYKNIIKCTYYKQKKPRNFLPKSTGPKQEDAWKHEIKEDEFDYTKVPEYLQKLYESAKVHEDYELENNKFYTLIENKTTKEIENMEVKEFEEYVKPMDFINYVLNLDDQYKESLLNRYRYLLGPQLEKLSETEVEDHLFGAEFDQTHEEVIEEVKQDYFVEDDSEAQGIIEFFEQIEPVSPYFDPEKLEKMEMIKDFRKNWVSTEVGDKMWLLHKKSPRYWTGERLGKAFAIPRTRAWGELLIREKNEAAEKGLPFNYEKTKIIFRREIIESNEHLKFKGDNFTKKSTKIQNDPGFVNEEDLYKDFLNETSKVTESGGYDDELPDWAALPFQERMPIEKEPEVKKLDRIKSNSNMGLDIPRKRIMFASIGKDVNESNREFKIREKDGTLRTASWQEIGYMGRKRNFLKAKHLKGMGGKKKKRLKFRRRDF